MGKRYVLPCTIEALQSVATPEGTQTHRPIAHITLVEWVREYCRQQGLEIIKEQYFLSWNQQQMIATFHLNWLQEDQQHTYMIALKNCHERKFAVGLTVGAEVKVCRSMVISGDWGGNGKRRHTMHSHPEIAHMIQVGVFRIKQRVPLLKARLEQLQSIPLSQEAASYRLLQIARKIPIHKIVAIWEEYLHPTYSHQWTWTEYHLLMAFTQIAKRETSLFSALKTYDHISRLFRI